MKVVINKCYGGFNLSHEAVMRYLEIKDIVVYPEQDKSYWGFWTYWLVKSEDRVERKEGEAFYAMPMNERIAYNKLCSEQSFYERDIERHDPVLAQVVEELGDVANGHCANLRVVDIPDGVEYTVEEYDGLEHIAEVHRTWE